MKKQKSLREQAEDAIKLEDLEYTSGDLSAEDLEKIKQSGDTPQYAPYFSSFVEFQNYILYEMNTRFKYLQEIDKNYYMCNFDRAEVLAKDKKERRSNIKSILTNMFVNRVVNMVLEFDKTFSILDKKAERRAEDQVESMSKSKQIVDELNALIDAVISDEDNKNAIQDGFKDAIKDGFTSQKIGVSVKKKTRKFNAYGINESITYNQEKVTVDYVSNYNIVYSYGSRRHIRFIAERLLLTDSQIKEEYEIKHGLKGYNPKFGEDTDHKILIPYDFETIKQSLVFFNYKNHPNIISGAQGSSASRQVGDDSLMGVNGKDFKAADIFSIKLDSKLREVYEVYHDEEDGLYMDVYVNGTYLGTTLCNSVIDGYKYYKLTYRRIPGGLDGTGVGTICVPTQRAYDTIMNSRIDNVIINTNTIYLKRRGLNIGLGNGNVDMSPGSIHDVDDTKSDISIMQRTSVPPEAYNEPDSMFQMLQAGIGIGSQVLGLQSKVERVSGQSDMLKAAADEQMNEFIESMNGYFNRLAKNIVIYYKTIISKETVEKIIGKNSLFLAEKIEDILLDISWSFDISSQKAKYNAALTQILINFLGVVGNLVDEGGKKVANVREIVMEIAKRQGLDGSTILGDEEVVRTLGDITKGMGVTDTSGVIPGGEDITALNQFGGAGSVGEFAPNAEGVN